MTDLLDIARRAAGEARGGEQIEAYVVRTNETDVEVFGGEVESLSVAGIEGIGVRVIADGRQGYAWSGSLDVDAIDDAVRAARDNASFSEPDEWAGLATLADARSAVPPELDLWRDDLAAVPTDEKVRIALELEAATKAADPRIRGVESAGYGDGLIESAIATSVGVEAAHRYTVCSASAFALAADGHETRTGYGFVAGRSLADLDLESIPRDAAERACRLLGATKPTSRRLPIVLDPLVTRSVLGVLAAALNGEAVLKGRSMFAERVGEQVAAAGVDLVDDPTDDRALGATPHDAEGVATRAVPLISGGVLRGFLHNVWTGRRSGGASTGSAVRGGFKSTPGVGARALRLAPGARSPEALVAGIAEGLYVQSVSGLHSGTNPVSGDFSVGAEGLMIRDGAFAEPVHELTIASTLPRMLLDLAEVADDLTFLPGSAAGVTVLIAEMMMSGA
ncbi:MAG TPA: TldD/PmbA family protein [Acidimicrobiia bacterium]|nr:TldD/PmbA family protein [Acidimicrobiia bacterium]